MCVISSFVVDDECVEFESDRVPGTTSNPLSCDVDGYVHTKGTSCWFCPTSVDIFVYKDVQMNLAPDR